MIGKWNYASEYEGLRETLRLEDVMDRSTYEKSG